MICFPWQISKEKYKYLNILCKIDCITVMHCYLVWLNSTVLNLL